MAKVSNENKVIAKKIVAVVGGNPSVTKYWDENESHYIDLLSLENKPVNGVTTVASLGLSDTPLLFRGKEYPVRVEILGCCSSQEDIFQNVISTAAFCIIKDRWFCAPGIIFPDIISMYYPENSMKHLFFTIPFLWEDSLPVMDLGTKKVAFLLGVPISEQEKNYAVENTPRDLETVFERENIDIFNIRRESVL